MEILEAIIDGVSIDSPVKEVRRGLFWTAVVSRNCGLASTMLRDISTQCGEHKQEIQSLTEKPAKELAQLSFSKDISDASLGLAAINSLVDIIEDRLTETNAGDFLLKEGAGRNISVIGHFPFTDALRRVATNLWVIEKWPQPGDVSEKDAEMYVPLSDIVAISGTTLINHTLSGILALCPRKSLKMLLGPTAPLTPVLFNYGINIVSGSIVIDTQLALKHISEGANFRQLKASGAVRLVMMTA